MITSGFRTTIRLGSVNRSKLHQHIVESIERRDPAATSKALIVLLDGAEEDVRLSLGQGSRQK